MATPQAKLLQMPGTGMGDAPPAVAVIDDSGNQLPIVSAPVNPAQSFNQNAASQAMAPVPQQPSALGFLSYPIQLPIFGETPLWLVALGALGIWYFVLPMLAEHKGKKR